MANLFWVTAGDKENEVGFDKDDNGTLAIVQNGRFSFSIIQFNIELTLYKLLIATTSVDIH